MTTEQHADAPTAVIKFGSPSLEPLAFDPDISISKLDLEASANLIEHRAQSLGPGVPSHGIEGILITVGNNRQLLIHKNLLCAASNYFYAAFNGAFQESSTYKLELKDQDADAFELFYNWLYSGSFGDRHLCKSALGVDVVYLRALKLADRVMAHEFRFTVYEHLRELFSDTFFRTPTEGFICELYNSDIPLDKLKQYVVAHSAY